MRADEEHRPWPVPSRGHVMAMRWEELAFLHWPVAPELLAPFVPPGLTLDTFEGAAWLGIVPFRMDSTRLRFLPAIPGTHRFLELNVRTYVTARGRPGVWFFSLDAASRLAVRGARRTFHLPYFDARMSHRRAGGTVHYASRRTHRGAPGAELRASYRALDAPQANAAPGSPEEFLTERYCLYAARADGTLLRGEVAHPPWRLRPGETEIERCEMTALLGFELPDQEPLVNVAEPVDVRAWWPKRVDAATRG